MTKMDRYFEKFDKEVLQRVEKELPEYMTANYFPFAAERGDGSLTLEEVLDALERRDAVVAKNVAELQGKSGEEITDQEIETLARKKAAQDLGRRGGKAMTEKYGKEHMAAIGSKGGMRNRDTHSPEFFSEIGRKGGLAKAGKTKKKKEEAENT